MQLGTITWIGLTMALIAFPSLTYAQQPETSVQCDEGVVPEPIEMMYGDHTVDCGIGPTGGDLDRFTFVGSAGDDVRIVIHTFGDDPDPLLQVLDPDGSLIFSDTCGTTTSLPCTIRAELILPLDGSYFINVSDVGSNATGSYQVQLEKIPPVFDPPALGYDVSETDEIDPVTDFDFFSFAGAESTDIRITVTTFGNNPDPRIQVRDPNGTLLDDQHCGTTTSLPCTITINLSLTTSGTYLITMFEQVHNGAGPYELTIQCIFGICPSTPPLVSDLSGRIQARGVPLAGANVVVRPLGEPRQLTTTDSMGVFEFETVPGGPFYMCITGSK